ncbi:hypothetical protein TEQG_07694 [Trichophyton equinum CBS 127.97]|uniref:Uncharacterized protein n=1 Tax=Trichophyton equinum (strain ATCC MYA-4606 / CBS 127.97) TaxID=559882 RepID=F2Q3L8_TRIEC|nr:hypothetical protein TEQG_07694 [Trichophyton equinum CBS 127.97]
MASQGAQDIIRDCDGLDPRWVAPICSYYDNLRIGGVNCREIHCDIQRIRSLGDLINEINDFPFLNLQFSQRWLSSFERFKLILGSFDGFVAAINTLIGGDNVATAVIWASFRPFPAVLLDKLEALGQVLIAKRQGHEIIMTPDLEDAFIDIYSKTTLILANLIVYCHNNPRIDKTWAWEVFNMECLHKISDIRVYSRLVDKNIDRIRTPGGPGTPVAAREIDCVQMTQTVESIMSFPCHMVPYHRNSQFAGRSTELKTLEIGLDPGVTKGYLKAIAICGMGGIGKTQLALEYVYHTKSLYYVVIWVSASSERDFVGSLKSFVNISGLQTIEGEDHLDKLSQRVKNWLSATRKKFLLVLDDVDNSDLIEEIWPASPQGSVIITSRSASLTSKWTTEVIHLQCLDVQGQLHVMFSLIGKHPESEANVVAAKKLLQSIGGLPLALVQIGQHMDRHNYTYEQFLPIYHRSAQKIFNRARPPGQYKYTVDTVWEKSFLNLPDESRTLLNILSFFGRNPVPASVLAVKKAGITNVCLDFLDDEFDCAEAVVELAEAGFVNRKSDHKTITVHPLVQLVVLLRLSPNEESAYFDHVVKMLFSYLADRKSEGSKHQGHGWASWKVRSQVIPHVTWLMTLSNRHMIDIKSRDTFAGLIICAAKYLWERERPSEAEYLVNFVLQFVTDNCTTTCAQAYRILGHVSLDMARPKSALSAYLQALKVIELLYSSRSREVADVYDSVACSYAEQGMVDQALQCLQKAVDIHTELNPFHMSRTQAIYALTYLRAWQPDKSLNALHHCWKLQNLTEELVIQSKYPKHSGDIMLLSKINFAQGRTEEAKKLATAAMNIRREVYGGNGPRVADSTFIIAAMSEIEGDDAQAAALLREVVEMSREGSDMQPHLARSLWFLARVEEKLGHRSEAQQLKVEAKEERERIKDREGDSSDNDETFMRLVPWMLW